MLKDPEFISYMSKNIEIFLDANLNSPSHANIWEALKAYMRGQMLSYNAHKIKQIRERLTKLERDIKKQEQDYIATKKEEHLNTLTKTRNSKLLMLYKITRLLGQTASLSNITRPFQKNY